MMRPKRAFTKINRRRALIFILLPLLRCCCCRPVDFNCNFVSFLLDLRNTGNDVRLTFDCFVWGNSGSLQRCRTNCDLEMDWRQVFGPTHFTKKLCRSYNHFFNNRNVIRHKRVGERRLGWLFNESTFPLRDGSYQLLLRGIDGIFNHEGI